MRLPYEQLIGSVLASLEGVQVKRRSNARKNNRSEETPWISSSISILLPHDGTFRTRKSSQEAPPNRTIQYLLASLEWREMSRIIGDELTAHLFANTIMLTRVQTTPYVIFQQISGRAFSGQTSKEMQTTRLRWKQRKPQPEVALLMDNNSSAEQIDNKSSGEHWNPLVRRRRKQNREIRRRLSEKTETTGATGRDGATGTTRAGKTRMAGYKQRHDGWLRVSIYCSVCLSNQEGVH